MYMATLFILLAVQINIDRSFWSYLFNAEK